MAKARKLPSGNWRAFPFIGKDANGKRQYKSFTAPTRKEAEFLAAQYLLKRKEENAPGNMTVGEAIDQYIESRSNVLAPSTVREYRTTRRNQLKSLMGIRLCNLTQDAIQQAVNIDALNHAPKTVRNGHGLLSAALAAFYPEFKLRTDLPQKVKHEIIVPERDEVSEIMSEIAGTDLELPVILSACLGLRRSEICALTGSDIIRKKSKLRINKAIVLDDAHTWVTKSPKSYAGTRTIDVPSVIMARLAQFPETADRIVACHPDRITYLFYRLKKRLGLNMRFHDLRHYNASIMHSLGVPDKYALERLGQATPNMLRNVYQHVMKDKRNEVSEKMNAYVNELMHHEIHHETENI